MERLTTYEIHADLELLKSAYESGASVENLDVPLRSVVSAIVSRAKVEPLSIYLCSPDHDAGPRNFFGFVLAKWIREHVPTALLVDCDFLSTGMSGIVPHRDALGFLDLLLYGTSLGVIKQEARAGVTVVGAGSFPVTKKSPFVMDAFDNTRRYLVSQARCVVYCGPALDDEENVHPVIEHVDLAVLVRTGQRFREGFLDPLEESIASSKGKDAWSVRLNTSLVAAAAEEKADALVSDVMDVVEKEDQFWEREPERRPAAPEPEEKPAPVLEDWEEEKETVEFATEGVDGRRVDDETVTEDITGPTFERKTHSSRWLRIVAPVVGIFVIGFVIWWLYLTKSVREAEQEAADMAAGPPVPGERSEPGAGTIADSTDTRVSDAAATGTGEVEEVAVPGEVVTGEPAERVAREAETERTEPTREPPDTARIAGAQYTNGILIAEELDAFASQYLVHVSSFRRLENARNDALYLMGWGYPVFLYHVDLGAKGIWYRVYVGPSDTREEATEFKIKLDENPRIQSTRISRVPG